MLIYYRSGYKYQLAQDHIEHTSIKPMVEIETEYLLLRTTGLLCIRKGYAWDGPSGPTWDTKNFMRGSLVHDALYQLLRLYPNQIKSRDLADKELRRICMEDGMSRIRSWGVYKAVRLGGAHAASPRNVKPLLIAP